jgi:hypothetical protein
MDLAKCDGLCIFADDLGLPYAGVHAGVVVYAHPSCPLHAPGMTCQCGYPDRCLSPTHGQVSLTEALTIKNRK